MKRITYPSEYFNIKDTLECGQIFRFQPFKDGFLVFSLDKCCYAYQTENCVVIECEDSDEEYFFNYFDLARDYEKIFYGATKEDIEILSLSATSGKGIRILNQDKEEMLFSFIVSQNNNIPRIKKIIEKMCSSLGKVKNFNGAEYFAFPLSKDMAQKSVEFFKDVGLGYRANYIKRLAEEINGGLDLSKFCTLDTKTLKGRLVKIYGVGPKVADCVALFGFHRSDSFPVDTWIEKVYKQDFKGTLTNREKIAEWFLSKFGENSGYFQQYLFHYKRISEKRN